MNIVELIKSILREFPKIKELHFDYSENEVDSYGLYSTGDTLIKEDILGNQTRQHTFALYAVYQSFNDYDRLANSGVLLELQMWLEQYADDQQISVTVGDSELKGTLTKLSCANGMVYDIPDENLNGGVQYQLQITADYKIKSEEF